LPTTWSCPAAVPSTDRAKVEAQLRDLLGRGLRGMGKTKAAADVQLSSGPAARGLHQSRPEPRDAVWVVTLQTPALLCEPEGFNDGPLCEGYQRVWSQLSADSLQMKRFYAQQYLAGGRYLYRRFQSHSDYRPWLLTDAGSVFVFEAARGRESYAQERIAEWLAHGLPLPGWVARDGSDWNTCPFLPENGFGEIAVNLDVHWDRRPKEGEYHVV